MDHQTRHPVIPSLNYWIDQKVRSGFSVPSYKSTTYPPPPVPTKVITNLACMSQSIKGVVST